MSTSLASAPRGPWPAVLSVALAAVMFCTTEFLPIGLLRYIGADLRLSAGTTGLMVTAPGLLAALSAPLIALWAGRLDRRRLLLALGALLAAANLVTMLAPGLAMLVAGRVLFGVALGGFWTVGAGLGGRLVPAASAGRATSLIFAGVSVGMLVGGAAGAAIGEWAGWRVAFGATLALSLVALAAQARWLPPLPVARRMPARELLGIVGTRAGRVGLAAMALALCGQFAAYTYVTPFLAQQARFGPAEISAILLGYTLIGLAGNFIAGAVAGRDVCATLAGTIALFVVPVLLLPMLAASQAATLLMIALWGLAYGAMPLALQVWMAQAAPHAPEGGMALFVANFQVSIALGSFVGGLVVDHAGAARVMSVGGVLGVAALAVLFGSGFAAERLGQAEPARLR